MPSSATPDAQYFFRISNYYGESVGSYLVRVVATKSYDAYEPNDDILEARTVPIGSAVKAAIMDKRDVDFFHVKAGGSEQELVVEVKNASSTLRPSIEVFDASKTSIGQAQQYDGRRRCGLCLQGARR